MPSKSKAQHNLMEGVAHNPSFAKKVGIPAKVGKDFATADKKTGNFMKAAKKPVMETKAPKLKKNPPAPMLGVYKKMM